MANAWDNDPVLSPLDAALAHEGVTGKLAALAQSIYIQESGGGKNTKTSNAGAVGGMQIIPATFASVADKGWDIKDPVTNARAGIRYLKQLDAQSGGDPALTAAGYYGGPGGMEKARRGVAVSDPRNPNAPNTLQYGQQVARRIQNPIARGLDAVAGAVMPSANAAEVPARGNAWDNDPIIDPATGKPPKQGTGSATLDAGNAMGTGFFRGLSRLAGLPVDTLANVRDLSKAAIGAPYMAMTGKPVPDWLALGDRSNDIGSGDNIIKNASRTAPGKVMLQPVNPEYNGGYAQAVGGALTGVINPVSGKQAVNQGVNSIASALLGKATYDATGNQALAIAAGMSPTALQSAVVDGTKYAVRGGEKGRKEMAQRIEDLKAAGVDSPTLGLASGNKTIGGMENLLQNTPGAVGVMQRNRDAALAGIEAKTMGAADLASTNRGALESGVSMKQGVKNFRENFKSKQTVLYDKLDQFIEGQTPTNVANTKATMAALNADIPGAPELSKQFKNARINAIEQAFKADTKGTPPGVMIDIRGGGGIMNAPVATVRTGIPAGSSTDSLPFEAVKKTRTLVGNEIADGGITADVPRSKWKPMYAALSEDMQTAAKANGPQAENALGRASKYTASTIKRLDRIEPIIDKSAPEQSFTALSNTLKENASTFQAVKKSLPEGARGDFAGTVIERLGKAKPGQQNEMGDKWSPESFLTNWNNMKPQARAELFSGFKNSAQVASDVEAVAKATSMMRDNSKMWANPSGTGANTFARGTIGSIALGGLGAMGGVMSPMIPLGAAGTLAGSNALARALTSQKNVKSLASRSYIDPQMLNSQVNALVGAGLLSNRNK